MQITIISVESGQVPGKKYKKAVVSFDNAGRKSEWSLFDFANPGVYAAITKANPGDIFDIEIAKNDKGYDQWIAATAAGHSAVPKSTPGVAAGRASTYETSDERALRQRLIVRQSSVSNAISILTVGAKSPPETKAVLELADELFKYVYAAPDLFDEPNDLPE